MRPTDILKFAIAGLMLAGCETIPEIVDQEHDTGHTVMGLDYRDFNKAAMEMVDDLLKSGAFGRPGNKPAVMVVSRITNKTGLNLDTDMLIKKIRVALMRAGKVQVTTAYGLNGPEDQMTGLVQDELGIAAPSVPPELSLSGKILEAPNRYDSSTTQLDYYFQLSMTDVKTGLTIWEDERRIIKRGSSRTVPW